MKTYTRRLVAGSILSIVLAAVANPAFAGNNRDRICTFGDSLSDTGNHFAVNHQVSIRPFDLIPSAPYLIGGLTFSNGKTWIQRLTKSLGRRHDAYPAFWDEDRFCNYAYGAARARPVGDYDLPNLVSRYLDDVGTRADPDTQYVIFVGGNDVRDAIVAYLTGGLDASTEILVGAVTSIVGSIQRLHAEAGARKFLVLNMPNLALVPAISLQGPEAQYLAQTLSVEFNSALTMALTSLAPLQLDVTTFDAFSFFNAVALAPPPGVTNVTDSCITPDVVVGAICADPDEYAFWDGIHPTRAIHKALAVAVRDSL